jgi:hypothetical protein
MEPPVVINSGWNKRWVKVVTGIKPLEDYRMPLE